MQVHVHESVKTRKIQLKFQLLSSAFGLSSSTIVNAGFRRFGKEAIDMAIGTGS